MGSGVVLKRPECPVKGDLAREYFIEVVYTQWGHEFLTNGVLAFRRVEKMMSFSNSLGIFYGHLPSQLPHVLL